tara:strand:+ start:3277 stop:3468 length:192 start_codon:yes stop_codon:yes gene_type:complete
MPDISMCKNDKCKFKEDCYRFTAKPSEFMQVYGKFDCKDKEGVDTFFLKNGIPSVQPKNKEDE